jgi:hypothetical protein
MSKKKVKKIKKERKVTAQDLDNWAKRVPKEVILDSEFEGVVE